MAFGIGEELFLPFYGEVYFFWRHLLLFDNPMRHNRREIPLKKIEHPVLHPPEADPQLIDAVSQIVRLWAAQFMP